MKRNLIIFIMLITIIAGPIFGERYEPIDFYVLIDTSLSMADAMPRAREHIAAELIGRIAIPGDWLCVIGFYGGQDVIWEGELQNEAALATLVRSVRALEATGRFTDIGAALDFLEARLKGRGLPERPKYMLMITDERQEAPYGTRYYSADYSIAHPMLEFIKKEDHGPYRVITIGYGLSDRIRGASELLMKTLSEPPARPSPALPGGAPGAQAGAAEAQPGSSAQASSQAGTSAAGGGSGGASGSPARRNAAAANGAYLLVAAAMLALLTILLLAGRRRKRGRDAEPKDAERHDHS